MFLNVLVDPISRVKKKNLVHGECRLKMLVWLKLISIGFFPAKITA